MHIQIKKDWQLVAWLAGLIFLSGIHFAKTAEIEKADKKAQIAHEKAQSAHDSVAKLSERVVRIETMIEFLVTKSGGNPPPKN